MTYHEKSFAVRIHNDVERVDAYTNAVKAKIFAATSAKKLREWTAAGNQDLYDWLNQTGEFEAKMIGVDEDGDQNWEVHAMCAGMFGGDFGKFLLDLADRLRQFGTLSEKQTAIVRKAYDRKAKWLAEANERRQARTDASDFIGTVGERHEFSGVVKKIAHGEGDYGFWHLTIVEVDSQEVAYWNLLDDKEIRAHGADEGDRVSFTARIKSHAVSKFGTKQTVVQRATKVVNHSKREQEAARG